MSNSEYTHKTEKVLFNNGTFLIDSYYNPLSGRGKMFIGGISSKEYEMIVSEDIPSKTSPYNPECKTRALNKGEKFPVKIMILEEKALMHLVFRNSSQSAYSSQFDLRKITNMRDYE